MKSILLKSFSAAIALWLNITPTYISQGAENLKLQLLRPVHDQKEINNLTHYRPNLAQIDGIFPGEFQRLAAIENEHYRLILILSPDRQLYIYGADPNPDRMNFAHVDVRVSFADSSGDAIKSANPLGKLNYKRNPQVYSFFTTVINGHPWKKGSSEDFGFVTYELLNMWPKDARYVLFSIEAVLPPTSNDSSGGQVQKLCVLQFPISSVMLPQR